jgi:hypothetical protein
MERLLAVASSHRHLPEDPAPAGFSFWESQQIKIDWLPEGH